MVTQNPFPIQDRYRDHAIFGFVDWNLRGIGQVVFQNNPLSGLIILLALFFNSAIYGTICILGVVVATATAMLLKADKGLVRDGLFGFNGALVALALVAFTSADFRTGAVPSPHMTVYIVAAAAMTTVAFTSIAALLHPHKVAALTAPFVLIGWLFLFAVLKFASIEAGPLAKPISPDQYALDVVYALPTWYQGIGNAIGQIFFQDNWITGYLIVVGIAVNSRISAGMALIGAAGAALVAVVFGGPEGAIRDGLFGYNAALTAIALGGFFLVLTWQSFLYTLFGIVVTTWFWASVAIFLEPIGMPVLTSTFVLVTWLMLLGQYGFKALIPVEPSATTTPEENRHRYLSGIEDDTIDPSVSAEKSAT
jgi:urea transporter